MARRKYTEDERDRLFDYLLKVKFAGDKDKLIAYLIPYALKRILTLSTDDERRKAGILPQTKYVSMITKHEQVVARAKAKSNEKAGS